MNKTKLYFPELDGLRFIAFLLVFLHHSPQLNFPGAEKIRDYGWIGVDLFLCLSAFLFARLLYKEFETSNTINVIYFYIRRGLRIWPIYFLFLFILLLYAVFSQSSIHPFRFLGLFTFTDNIMTALKDYSQIPYTAHLWTISYEEQFYVFIPWILLFLFRSSRRRKIISIGLFVVICLVIRSIFIQLKVITPVIWVLPVTHFESITLGLVVGIGGYDKVFSRIHPVIMGVAGLILFGMVTMLPNVGVIGWNLMATYVLVGLSTSFVLYSVTKIKDFWWIRWIAKWPFTFLGKISYGLYLYHLWINSVTDSLSSSRYYGALSDLIGGNYTHVLVSLIFVITVSTLSYLIIEKPILRQKKRFEMVQSRPL
jgi:peptidoglycan/LPS O-acetylase OafA/YrhL